jgi:hypothetical protein
MDDFEDDMAATAAELADYLDEVDAYVQDLLTPEELEIRLLMIQGHVAIENYLKQF